VNLHFGLCPHYRGALANQHAVLRDDISKIGATILYINGKPDTGEILSTISACHTLPPKELFQDLNERASTRYLEVVKRLHAGEEWTTTSQEMKSGANLLLKHWTPRMRYNLGKKIVEWERRHDA
ncbi:MAG: formyltransferase family protein, partial [Parcubacteria group bacterium]